MGQVHNSTWYVGLALSERILVVDYTVHQIEVGIISDPITRAEKNEEVPSFIISLLVSFYVEFFFWFGEYFDEM